MGYHAICEPEDEDESVAGEPDVRDTVPVQFRPQGKCTNVLQLLGERLPKWHCESSEGKGFLNCKCYSLDGEGFPVQMLQLCSHGEGFPNASVEVLKRKVFL